MTRRRILTAREQYELLSPWTRVAILKEARYPQEWRGDAPYGYLPSGRARNRPPSVLRDPDDPDAGIIDPSEITYKYLNHSVSAYHPNGDHLGNYSWEEGDGYHPAHIGIAQVNPQYQGQGVSGGIIDHIREHHEPDLVHSGYRGVGSLSYQGRAGALRDLGNTEEEHNDYFNTKPYNYGDTTPSQFYINGPNGRQIPPITDAQREAHAELMKQFEEDKQHPNYTGVRSSGSGGDPDLIDEYGDRHEYGYDANGDYVGLSNGGKNDEGYSEEGYDHRGYDRDGYDRDGLDEEGFDQDGFHNVTGLNRDGETRHGYTPGDGTPPEGTVPMSQMAEHWHQNGLPTPSQDHLDMMDDAFNDGVSPTMYAVRQPYQRSTHTNRYHVGNGDTVYSSLERARQVAYHPDNPHWDKDIVSVDHLDPDHLHTDASGATPEDFHYAPPSDWDDAEDTASTPADIVHDPVRHQRILSDLGQGWSTGTALSSTVPYGRDPTLEYQDPNNGRSGRMYQGNNGMWYTEHQPEFGRPRRGNYYTYREAADAIREGTKPGPTMEQHALEVNNDYQTTGGGTVDWEPHPNGQGLMAHTPHGDLHVVQDPDTGSWTWHAGPHGFQPGDEGGRRGMLPESLYRATSAGAQAIARSPFHGGLADELGEGWSPHPVSAGAYTQRLPSGNHAIMKKNEDGTYESGIQRDDGSGRPSNVTAYRDGMPDLDQALAFIQHRDSPVPASKLGKGWEDYTAGRRSFPSYLHESHPSGAVASIRWSDQGGWKSNVRHQENEYEDNSYESGLHKTPQAAAAWANKIMDKLPNK